MIHQTEADFAAKLKNYAPNRVYFLYGGQNYLKKLYLKKIIAQTLAGAFPDFNLSRFDGRVASLNDISDAVEALPMMAERRCVVVEDLDVGKLAATDTAKLTELLKNPPESTVLIFIVTDVAVEVKKSAKWRNFIKLVDAVGDVVELGARTATETNRFLRTLAERGGCSISGDACYYLVERCGDDMQVLQNEMNKLCAYKSGEEITKADIHLCAVAVLDASVFDLSKLMIKGDFQGAMQNLDELLALREEPVMILGALSGSFIDLYRAKVARENSKTAAELCSVFSAYKGKEWRLKNALRDCDKYTKKQLVQVLALLAKADYRLKSSRTDNVIILQETLARMFDAMRAAG